jgi:anaerobic selenocysteine-containing dehydrogenase
MKRRDFLKSSLLLAAVSTVVGKAAGLLNSAVAAPVPAAVGKLGYKVESPQKANNKMCSTCKHYKAGKDGKGLCVLPAMINAMGKPADGVEVVDGAYCNMWAKKA